MEIPEIATRFREQNGQLIPLLLIRLRKLKIQMEENLSTANNTARPFAHFSTIKSPPYRGEGIIKSPPLVYRRSKYRNNCDHTLFTYLFIIGRDNGISIANSEIPSRSEDIVEVTHLLFFDISRCRSFSVVDS